MTPSENFDLPCHRAILSRPPEGSVLCLKPSIHALETCTTPHRKRSSHTSMFASSVQAFFIFKP